MAVCYVFFGSACDLHVALLVVRIALRNALVDTEKGYNTNNNVAFVTHIQHYTISYARMICTYIYFWLFEYPNIKWKKKGIPCIIEVEAVVRLVP